MAITSLADYGIAFKQRQRFFKSMYFSNGSRSDGWYDNNLPPAGTVPASTAAGTVPTSATVGAMQINPFSGTGYITSIDLSQAIGASLVLLYDRLWHAGPFLDQLNAPGTYTLSSQPSFSSRIPGGTDYTGLQLWVEAAAGFNNSSSTVTVTYTNESGTPGRTTGAFVWANSGTNIAGNTFQVPLQAGDTGIQLVESVTYSSNANNNSKINVFIVRPLWQGIIIDPLPASKFFGLEQVGMPQVWSNSCLSIIMRNASGLGGQVEMLVEIAAL